MKAAFLGLFIPLLILNADLTAQFNLEDMASNDLEARSGLKYPTYEQYVSVMSSFASMYPDICQLVNFGSSRRDRQLLALKISDNVTEDEAESRFLYTSTMHGNELVGYPLMIRLIDKLLTGYGNDAEVTSLVDGLEIWINPLANPDGTYYDGNESVEGAIRENYGIDDLNRNFPDLSKGEEDDIDGRPLENRNMMLFLREHRFNLSANFHTGYEVVNYPWDWTYDLHVDDAWYRLISREYADETHSVDPTYMMEEEDGIVNGAAWYVAQGTRQDYVNYFLEGREVTIELAHEHQTDSDSLESLWQKNERSFMYYMTQASYGIQGTVTSKESGAPVAAEISIPGYDQLYSIVHSTAEHGDFYRYLKGGTYDLVVSSEGYVNDTVWAVEVNDYQATMLDVVMDSVHPSDPDPVFDINDMAEDLEEALTFSKYPTYEQYVQMMQNFSASYPEICKLDTLGYSSQDRLMLALKISDNAAIEEAEADFLYTSTDDGADLVGYILLLRLADYLLKNYGEDTLATALVNNLAIWIHPLANPDGTYAGGNHTVEDAQVLTAQGIHLNRSYPDPSAGESDDTGGRAPETRALMELMKRQSFSMSAGLYAGFEVVNYPWDHSPEKHVDEDWFRDVASEYVSLARSKDPSYLDQFEDGLVQGADWEIVKGSRQDYINHYLGGRDVTIGLSYSELLESDSLDHYWNLNKESLLAYMQKCSYGIRGRVTSAECGCPLEAKVSIPGHDKDYSVAYASGQGDFYRLIREGCYVLEISAEGYTSRTIEVSVPEADFTFLEIELDSIVKNDTIIFDLEDMATSMAEALSFGKYPSFDQYLQIMNSYASDYPELCSLVTIGTSTQGRQLLALKISDHVGTDESEPRFLLSAVTRGDDLAGYVLSLRLAKYLLDNYGTNDSITRLVDQMEIWITPLANPDGAYHAGNHTLEGAQARNALDQDLEGDFPDPSILEEDSHDDRATETRHMMIFLKEQMFNLSAGIQGGASRISYPWDHSSRLHADDDWFRMVAEDYLSKTRETDPEYLDGLSAGAALFEHKGGRKDYVTYYLGGREFSLLLSKTRMLDSDFLDEYWQKNRDALTGLITQGIYGIRGTVSCKQSGNPVKATIQVLGQSDYGNEIFSRESGAYFRYLKEGDYTLRFSAESYVSKDYNVSAADGQSTELDAELDTLIESSIGETGLQGITLYPNPAGEILYIDLTGEYYGPLDLTIVSTRGELVVHERVHQAPKFIDIKVEHLESGMYFLRLVSGNEIRIAKFLKH